MDTNRYIIMGGDFNVSLDNLGKKDDTEFSGAFLLKAIKNYHLQDAYRKINKTDLGFTWGNTRGHRSRLDYFLVSQSIKITGFRVLPCWCSDHEMVVVTTRENEAQIGKGYWRMNLKLLEDTQFLEELKEYYKLWQEFKKGYNTSLEWWEECKRNIAGFCVIYSGKKRRQERKDVWRDNKKLQKLMEKRNRGIKINEEEVAVVKQNIKSYYIRKSKEFAFLAKAEELDKDEKVTKYFFETIKQKQTREIISSFFTDTGEVKGTEGILKHACSFYKELFSKREIDEEKGGILLGNINRILTEESRSELEGEITEEEIKRALFSMKGNKTPGGDGLPKEFYVCLWEIIKNDLVEIFREVYKNGKLTTSMKSGIVHLIYKKGERKDIKNWRPVTLLGTDYKILSKVLANRLKEVLEILVSEDQTCGVKGRAGSFNLSLIRDVISWVEERNLPLCLLSLDQEKAFDRVSHVFLFKVLQTMNLGEEFISWVKILYNNVNSRIKVNGFLSEPLEQNGGVRQGCPLSPLLYVLFIEPLVEMLRNEKQIEGVHIPGGWGEKVKVAQYADDTTVFLSTDRGLEKTVAILENYCKATGSAINFNKSSVMYCGRWRYRTDVRYGFSVCPTGIKILGVKFYHKDSANHNWEETIVKVKKKLNIWKGRKLSIMGRGLVVRVDLLSSLIYLALIFPIPTKCKIID